MRNQYNVCLEVIKRFQEAGILQDLVIIGSWCLFFYKYYFKDPKYVSAIRTRDIDFLIPRPTKIGTNADVVELVKDLGFVIDFKSNGLIRLSHAELTIEFLVPEIGKGVDAPCPIKRLGINAQALRYLDMLRDYTVAVNAGGLNLVLPHPVAFALHKLIISGRRRKEDKAEKDMANAVNMLNYLNEHGLFDDVLKMFRDLPNKWQRTILKKLDNANEKGLKLLFE